MTQTAIATLDDTLAGLRAPTSAGYLVTLGDAIEVMRRMPTGSVDVSIVDPPYNEETHANVSTLAGGTPTTIGVSFDPLASFDFVGELLRVTRRWVLCFCALEDLGAYKVAAGGAWSLSKTGAFVRSGVWDKPDGAPQITGDRPAQGAEGIAIMHSRTSGIPLRWNGGGNRATYRYGRVRTGRLEVVKGRVKSARDHETQKPIELMDKLIAEYTERGEVVFDPFMGSGSTGVSALKAERRFYGIDRAQQAADNAVRRLAAIARIVDARRD